jgi:hypothetical protein
MSKLLIIRCYDIESMYCTFGRIETLTCVRDTTLKIEHMGEPTPKRLRSNLETIGHVYMVS